MRQRVLNSVEIFKNMISFYKDKQNGKTGSTQTRNNLKFQKIIF